MVAYKAFEPGLVATRGNGRYKYKVGLNVATEANCARNGFHCAENPLDCLNYYSWDNKNEFWLVEAGGDIDEDGSDSRISCTMLTPIERLTLYDFLVAAANFMIQHPKRETHSNVLRDKGTASNGYCSVRGENPLAKAKKPGEGVVWIQEKDGEVVDASILIATGKYATIGVYRNIMWEVVNDA